MWQRKQEELVAGPENISFPSNTEWTIGDEVTTLQNMSIKFVTRARQAKKMKPPPAEKAWTEAARFHGLTLRFDLYWKLKPKYASKRDQLTWFKLKHRNLYVANRDDTIQDQRCLACLLDPESMIHLAQCSSIYNGFWLILINLMKAVNIRVVEHGHRERAAFLNFWKSGAQLHNLQ